MASPKSPGRPGLDPRSAAAAATASTSAAGAGGGGGIGSGAASPAAGGGGGAAGGGARAGRAGVPDMHERNEMRNVVGASPYTAGTARNGPVGGRPRSQSFYGPAEHAEVGAARDVRVANHQREVQARLSAPLTTLLHNPGDAAARAGIGASGLLPMNHPSNPTGRRPYGGGAGGSNHDPASVYAAGPAVIAAHHSGDGAAAYAHVVARDPAGFIHDHDYDHMGGRNDSQEHHGAIPPARHAQFHDPGPVSFTLPLTPRTSAGLSRYLTGSEAHATQATAAVGARFQERFGNMGFLHSYNFPGLPGPAPGHGAAAAAPAAPAAAAVAAAPAASAAAAPSGIFADRERERGVRGSTAAAAAAPLDFSRQAIASPAAGASGLSALFAAPQSSAASAGSGHSAAGHAAFGAIAEPARPALAPHSAFSAASAVSGTRVASSAAAGAGLDFSRQAIVAPAAGPSGLSALFAAARPSPASAGGAAAGGAGHATFGAIAEPPRAALAPHSALGGASAAASGVRTSSAAPARPSGGVHE